MGSYRPFWPSFRLAEASIPMEPEIMTGSICFVDTNTVYDDISKGDIVAFETATGIMVTHRVISVTDFGLETKGDANEVSDGISTTKDNYAGKTIFSIPYLGYISNAITSPRGRIIAFTAIGLLLLSSFLSFEKKEKE